MSPPAPNGVDQPDSSLSTTPTLPSLAGQDHGNRERNLHRCGRVENFMGLAFTTRLGMSRSGLIIAGRIYQGAPAGGLVRMKKIAA